MEENRLKPMPEGYSVEVFNDIYAKTEYLRKKLASQIDSRRFGVDYNEVLSWFDVKFLHCFNKYYAIHNPDVLKGHIIQGLQFFKMRILRAAYTHKNTQSIINIDDVTRLENVVFEEDAHNQARDLFRDLALGFMKQHLSENAYELLMIQIDPPHYIIQQLKEEGAKNLNKIPNPVIADYLGLGTSNKADAYLNLLKKEIGYVTKLAHNHFRLQHTEQNLLGMYR